MTEPPSTPQHQEPAPASNREPQDEQLRQLIKSAFEAARESGRPDWQQMTIAVLKNRLLDLTSRTFSERDYGARTIGELVESVPDLLLVDKNSHPPIVKLVSEAAPAATTPIREAHVRSDLWNAIIDYRSGNRYVWDGTVAVPEDPNLVRDTDVPIMPTISPSVLGAWREKFVQQVRPLVSNDQAIQNQLDHWYAEQLPARALPGLLRERWSAELTSNVVERLTGWFSDEAIAPPPDIVQPRKQARTRASSSVSTGELRDLVMRCVRVMTDDELRALSLPPAAILRAQR